MRTLWSSSIDRRARPGWFAETLVVLGILAFAYFAVTLQNADAPVTPVPAIPTIG